MPKIGVEIEWDSPNDPFWLNPDNVCLALSAYCPNTHFDVRGLTPAAPDPATLAQFSDEQIRNEVARRRMCPTDPQGG
jgi:hypothetical protein